LTARLQDADSTAETAEELTEFETDVAATENQQVVGNSIEFHDGRAVERCDGIESIQPGTIGARAGIDKDMLRFDGSAAAIFQLNVDGFGSVEAGIAEYEIDIRSFFDARLSAIAEAVDDLALAVSNFHHVNGDRPGMDAVVGSAPGKVGNAGAGDHGFSRSAANVNARAPHVLAFDECGTQAGCGSCPRKWYGSLARADNDDVVLIGVWHESEP